MLGTDAIHDPSRYPIENPNPVFRANPGGLLLFANRASDALLAAWRTSVGGLLPTELCRQIADTHAAGNRQCSPVTCGDRIFELDFVPIPAGGYVNVYGRDITEQEAARREREVALTSLQESLQALSRGEAALRSAYEAAVRSEARYRLLFDSIDEGFCIVEVLFDENEKPVDYRLLETNPAFERQTGLVNATGRRMRDMVPQHEERWFETYGRIALTGVPERFENAAEQLRRYYDVYAFRVGEPAERKVAVLFNDIAPRKQIESDLRHAHEELEQRVQERTAELERANEALRFQASVLENVNDAIIAYNVADLRITAWNRRAEEQYGWSAEEALGGYAPDVVRSETDPEVRAQIVKMVTEEGWWRGELRHAHRDGTTILVETTSSALRDDSGQIVSHVTANRDITERKRLEDELRASREQLRHLSHRLVERQENERRFVANELYNDEGQRLAVLLLELGQLEKEVNGNPAISERIARMRASVDGILVDMHGLAVGLRPVSLDRLGLIPALRQYAEGLGAQHGVTVQVEVNGTEKAPLGPDSETILYRIAQEAVINAVRHSHASHVDIVATKREDLLIVVIDDDGDGFDVEEAVQCGGLGIVGMRERAEMLGGTLTIESEPGKGTAVFIEAPLR